MSALDWFDNFFSDTIEVKFNVSETVISPALQLKLQQ